MHALDDLKLRKAVTAHVRFFHGDITRLTCDVIVNSVHADVACGAGALDDAVRSAAGPQLTDALLSECGERVLDVGDVLTTTGFALPAQFVVHARVPSVTDSNHAQQLSETFAAVFDAFDQLDDVSSLAVPMLGIGGNDIDVALACEILMFQIEQFLSRRVDSARPIPTVCVVLHDIFHECVASRLVAQRYR